MTGEKIQEKSFLIVFFFVFLTLVPIISSTAAEDIPGKNEYFAIGTGTIVKGDLVRGKKSALRNALFKGVENYLVRLLGNQAVAAHFESLALRILPGIDQEIENFHILAEKQTGNRYNVFVKIKINENSMAEKLRETGIFQTVHQSIKILFMVSERRGPVEVFWWQDAEANPALTPIELALHGIFQERGFNPVNRIMDLPSSDLLTGQFSSNLQPREAVQWGKLFSADVVVCGQSLILDDKLILNLKAIDVQTGYQICKQSGSQNIPSGNVDSEKILDIMRQCVGRMAVDLCPCILKNINTAPKSIHQLDVTLAGISQPRQFQTFSEFLKTHITGVKSVTPSRISDDSMSATVDFQGDRITFISLVLNNQDIPFPLHLGQTDTENILFYLE
ncbi:MAG: hypothetical protein LJE96_20890 [Deltaproteobacteria bacterium]|nr:hypothetical protein [Deltaproteobacteria bacterium]